MSTHKHIDMICVAVLVAGLMLTGLFMVSGRIGLEAVVDADSEKYSDSEYFTDNDQNGSWDTSGAVEIVMNGDGCDVSGQDGVYSYDGNVVIGRAGRYVVSGNLNDGSLIVDAKKSSKVWICLEDAQINCSDDAAFRIDQAEKVFLTLAEGTNNIFKSGEEYNSVAISDGTGGVIYAHDDLTVNGSGGLSITGAYRHGIDANDDLVICGGDIEIEVPEDGINVNDSVRLKDASIVISAGDDGIHTDSDFVMTDGKLEINKSYEGLEALAIDIKGGDIAIYSQDDGINANGGGADMMGLPARQGQQSNQDHEDADEDEETYVKISGGSISIINTTGMDCDGIDSNGDIIIDGGILRISLPGRGSNNALDYGSERGGECVINGGNVVACGGAGMIEEMSEASKQCSIMYCLGENTENNTMAALKDESGNVLISYIAPKGYSSVIFSCPEMEQGKKYTVMAGDEKTDDVILDQIAVTAGEYQSLMEDMGKMGNRIPEQRGGAPDDDRKMDGHFFEKERQSDTGSEDTADTRTDIREADRETKLLLAAAAAVIIMGLIFAGKYKRSK